MKTILHTMTKSDVALLVALVSKINPDHYKDSGIQDLIARCQDITVDARDKNNHVMIELDRFSS